MESYDEHGHLKDPASWSEEWALKTAALMQLELSPTAMQVLTCLRQFYADFGYSPGTRPLVRYLNKMLGENMTNALLMDLFKTGTVARTVTRLAGLPKPPNCL